MDYDANTVVDMVSGKAHHCGIRWLQMRVVRAMVEPSDCVTTRLCKLSTVLSSTPS